jgi:hypothetical protein
MITNLSLKINMNMVIEKESSPDAQEQKANSKLYPKALKLGFANKDVCWMIVK